MTEQLEIQEEHPKVKPGDMRVITGELTRYGVRLAKNLLIKVKKLCAVKTMMNCWRWTAEKI